MRASILRLLLLAATGCGQSVGTDCDDTLARTIVYDPSGSPAYAGQAMLIQSCAGDGSFCHADTATNRYGAPFGMNFDPTLADGSRFGVDELTGARHLRDAQVQSHRFRDDIYSQVTTGLMPPGNAADATMGAEYRSYTSAADTIGTPLPSLRSADGREMLRNWLACRSPVVESTGTVTTVLCNTDDDCFTRHCDTSAHACIAVGAVTPARAATTANWTSLYTTIFQPTCAISACHGTAGAAVSGNLDMSTAAVAYAALIGVPGSNAVCGTRITPGNPDTSYFVAKLEGTQDPAMCGTVMPSGRMLSMSQIALVRTWITGGAPMD